MKLYYHNLSGHSHRVRLFLSLLGVDYEPVLNVDLAGYPNVLLWLHRMEAQPGFLAFDKTPVGLAA
ncbi:hypothetical protein C8J98_102137 [Luteibacter sp. OK325]|uniref:hypothetical protein n=1 Tax=Luteibacter sp. OK325 TaxID=2135670 RepID=UPI000D36DF64|nr:hypothetical protein [Luteibacter sp. OK325]PTR33950.1 hypothetical protein C8J98_102137 [Luteibacter sp. OK325]